MIDDLHRNPPCRGLVKRPGGVAIQRCPGFCIYLRFQGGFQRFVRVVGAEEVGLADEEAFFVVVGVDEPAGDAVGAVAVDFAAVGVEDVDAVDLDADLAVFSVEDVDVGFAENDEEIAFAGVLEVVGHVQVSVHARLEDGDATKFVEFAGVGVVVEGAGDEHVESGVGGLSGGGDQIGAGDCAKFGADENGSAALGATPIRSGGFQIATVGTDQFTRPGGQGSEVDLAVLVGLLHSGSFEVFENDLGEVAFLAIAQTLIADFAGIGVDEFVIFIHAQYTVGGKAFDGEGTGDTDLFLVVIGLVVEILEVGLGGDGGIYGLLAGDAGLPEPGEGRMGAGRPVGGGIAGDFPVEQGADTDGFAAGQGGAAIFRRVKMQELALPSASGDFVGRFMTF